MSLIRSSSSLKYPPPPKFFRRSSSSAKPLRIYSFKIPVAHILNCVRAMGQLVSGYLDFAERQAEREQAMTMKDWAKHLDRILTMSGEQLLSFCSEPSEKTEWIFPLLDHSQCLWHKFPKSVCKIPFQMHECL